MTASLEPGYVPGGTGAEPQPWRRISCEEGFTTPEILAVSSALFHSVPGWGPEASATELERAVNALGLRGP